MYFLYHLLLLLTSPLLAAWLSARALSGRLPGWAQRFGQLPESFGASRAALAGPRAWLHAVSLGEVKVAVSLAAELRRRVPGVRFAFTTSTRTGHQEALRHAAPEDAVLYAPLDFPWICRKFLRRLRPDLLLIVETELWPSLFREARRAGVPVWIVNGRISDRSWPRYRATRWFWPSVLQHAARVYAASDTDAERFRRLGVPSARLALGGNLKFLSLPEAASTSGFVESAAAQMASSPQAKLLVAGSTMPGEESILIDAFRALRREWPELRMILAPRHPERFGEVARLILDAEIPLMRRSELDSLESLPAGGILLLDTIGELAAVYQLATVAFVGGTLVPAGGHNVLEPACFAKPIVIGPSMENFRAIAAQFLAADSGVRIPEAGGAQVGALVQIPSAASLAAALRYLLANPEAARRIGQAARDTVERNRQQTSRVIDAIVAPLTARSGALAATSRTSATPEPRRADSAAPGTQLAGK